MGSASPVPSRLILKSPDRVGKMIAVMVKVPNDTIKGLEGLDWTGLDWTGLEKGQKGHTEQSWYHNRILLTGGLVS